MVTAFAPYAIFVGVAATVGFIFVSFWGSVNRRATARAHGLADRLDRAGMRMKPQEIVLTVSSLVAMVWIIIVVALRPPILVAILSLPAVGLLGALFFSSYVKIRIARRLDAFVSQLEIALRLIASGVRVGLGMRQALMVVIEELGDPARYEFRRVIGETNIGVSILDAIDDLAERMPSNETLMMARVFRVQAQTGGDLARVLEGLANTIKARRQVQRKIGALTAEGRMSSWVLTLIPLFIGGFIVITQPQMGHSLIYTFVGHLVIAVVFFFEIVGYFWIKKILQVEV